MKCGDIILCTTLLFIVSFGVLIVIYPAKWVIKEPTVTSDLHIPMPDISADELYKLSCETRRKTLVEIIPECCCLCVSQHFTRFWNQEAAHWMHRSGDDQLMICTADPILKKLVGEGHYTFKELTREIVTSK